MKAKLATIAMAALGLCSCGESTDLVGGGLTPGADKLSAAVDTFDVETRSVAAGPVLATTAGGYVGSLRDPETGAYTTCHFMTQLHSIGGEVFPPAGRIASLSGGLPAADSCELRIFYTAAAGDTLAPITIEVAELSAPMLEDRFYDTSFDPAAEGLLRTGGAGGSKTFTLADMAVPYSIRKLATYSPSVRVKLAGPYTAADGTVYDNYGTYLMRAYYALPGDFSGQYDFLTKVLPGFAVRHAGGLGAMAKVDICQLSVYYRYEEGDSVAEGAAVFPGTEEVLTATQVDSDSASIARLVADNSCTYVKAPAGIFTEIGLPVDRVYAGRAEGEVRSAKLELQRVNHSSGSQEALPPPGALLILPADSAAAFFEKGKIADNRTSFIATYDKAANCYSFGNIAGLLQHMAANRGSARWNKALAIPVQITTTDAGTVTKVSHEMSLTSTRLAGGEGNTRAPVRLSVIYGKYE